MRGSIRSEILENIPMSMLLVPFMAMRYAGDYHVAAVVFGVAFFALYAAVMYGYAGGQNGRFKLQNYGSNISTSGYRLVDMCIDAGNAGRFFLVIYIVRFMIRAGFAVYVVALILSEKNTVSFWFVAVSFVLICMYGASGSFAKRRVLGNLLIYWMLIPLILLVIFSISRMNYGNIAEEYDWLVSNAGNAVVEKNLNLTSESGKVFGTAWKIVAVMSSFELVLFSFARTRKNEKRQSADIIRVAVWLGVSVLLSYVYVLGMLGNKYVESSNRISLGNKTDYVLALSWLIGAFFVISSYIFYVKEMMLTFADDEIYVKALNRELSEGKRRDRDVNIIQEKKQVVYFKVLLYGLIFTGILFFICCFHYNVVRLYMINWLVYGDVALSLLLPAILQIVIVQRTMTITK